MVVLSGGMMVGVDDLQIDRSVAVRIALSHMGHQLIQENILQYINCPC